MLTATEQQVKMAAQLIEHVLLVPREFFVGLQTISVSQYGSSKWLDYSVKQDELSSFFISLGNKQ